MRFNLHLCLYKIEILAVKLGLREALEKIEKLYRYGRESLRPGFILSARVRSKIAYNKDLIKLKGPH